MDGADVTAHALELLKPRLRKAGIDVHDVGDDFHLLDSGVLDSLSMLEFLEQLEAKLGTKLQLDDVEPTELFTFGTLVRAIVKMPARS